MRVHRPTLSVNRLDPSIYLDEAFFANKQTHTITKVEALVKRIRDRPKLVKKVTFDEAKEVNFYNSRSNNRSGIAKRGSFDIVS